MAFLLLLQACQIFNQNNIDALESELEAIASVTETELDIKKIQAVSTKLAKAYEEFAESHPSAEKTPEYLYKSADLYRSYNIDQRKAAILFEKLYDNYPTYIKSPDALFHLGFIYNNHLNNTAKAREVYAEFISKYPDHNQVVSAEFELQHLGKSSKDILEEITADEFSEMADTVVSDTQLP